MQSFFGRWTACVLSLLLGAQSLIAADPTPGRSAEAGNKPASKSVSARSLAPLLKPTSEPLRLKLLAGLDASSLNDAAVTDVLGQFAVKESQAGRFSMSLVRAVQLLGQSGQPTAAKTVTSLLSATDPRVVMLSADVVSTTQRDATLEPLVRLAQRKEYPRHFGFRRTVVDAVARYPQKPAVDFLVQTVDESRGQLKFEAARHLMRTTGQNFGGHADEWQTWWKENRNAFQFAAPAPALASASSSAAGSSSATASPSANRPAPAGLPWPEPVPEFYGVPIYAQRVCFVIDRSKSMASSVDGETRLERAVQELEHAIQALPEYAYFNIVAFDTDIKLLRRELIQATSTGKREGISFAYGLSPGELTNCHDALMAGLEVDENLEAMLFLSDGEPTAGPIIEPFAIVDAVTERNAFQRTTINTIGIDARGVHEEFLRQLAGRNFGQYKSAR